MPELTRRRFGHSALEVTSICIGSTTREDLAPRIEAEYPVPEDRHAATFRAMFDSPINFLDTAAAYGDGESERRIGLVLRELGGLPNGFVLATKADRHLETNDFSGDQTQRSVERSLKLLGLDHLQIVYLHDPEYAPQTFEDINAPGAAVDVLVRLKEQGVIDVLGISGGPIDMLMRYVDTGLWDAVISHNGVAVDPGRGLAAAGGACSSTTRSAACLRAFVLRIGVDIGGTFTDLVLLHADGRRPAS